MDIVGRTLLGKYTVERLLGQGGMGSVWLGTHVGTGRKVAIKVLDDRFLGNVAVVQRFGREARAASAVEHEGIVEVLDLDQTEEGVPFLVMEFLEGESLAGRIERKGKLGEPELATIALLLLEALHAAHERGVVHRDLKPDNIFLVPAGRRGELVKILDFGISSKDDEQASKLTQTGSVLGTPHYMSPEQAMGDTTVDRRVDIYATGVLLYECAVGDVPFDAPNYNKLLRVILDGAPQSPIDRGALIGKPFEAAILWALAKEREDRPATAAVLADAIREATKGRAPAPSAARRVSIGPPRPAGSPSPDRTSPAAVGSPSAQAATAPAAATPAMAAASDSALASWANASLDLAQSPSTRSAPRAAPKAAGGPIAGFDDFGPAAAERAPLAFDEEAFAGARRSGTVKRPADLGADAHSSAPVPASAPVLRGSLPPSKVTPLPRSAISGPNTASAGDEAGGLVAAPVAAERPWWLPLALRGAVALAVFLALVGALRWVVQPGVEDAAVPAPRAAATPDAGPLTSPDWVMVSLTGLPTGADVRLDGLPGVALPMRLRRGTHHRIVVRAPGYVDRTIELDATANATLHVDIQPL